jgi:ankyrin repeat protein
LDVVEWTARAFTVHVPMVMFPATQAVVVLWQEVDRALSRAEEDDHLAVFTAAQTGQHLVLDKLLVHRSSSWQVWWRYLFSRTASHESRAPFQPALCAAAANGQVECVRRLLDAGADADRTRVFGVLKPAEHAVRSDDADTLQLLLAAKASANTGTLLTAATNGASADVVRHLLDASDENVYLGSVLAQAAKHHHDPQVVQMLLEAKASVHEPVHWAYTGRAVLYYAAKNVTPQRTAIVQLLLDAKAHVNYDNRAEKSPLDVAATDDVAALLRAHGARRNVDILP